MRLAVRARLPGFGNGVCRCRMSALGQKLPRRLTAIVSALPPKAAATIDDRRVRLGPKADILGL